MRIVIVAHGFPPLARGGVEVHSEELAAALARSGERVEVFAPRPAAGRAHLTTTRERRPGYGLTWLWCQPPQRGSRAWRAPAGVAEAFGRFLDRVRPEVVHFQHLLRLGPGLVEEARRRGVATLYTAHDPFPVCGDWLLLRPDLHPLLPGDVEGQARCELARRWLVEQPGFAGVHGYCLEEQLGEEQAEILNEILHGETQRGGFAREELDRTVDEISRERDEWREAFARVDRLLSPTIFLAALLREGGLRKPIVVEPMGIDVAALRSVPPLERRVERPLAVGYLGGVHPHKGVHVLLDARERMRQPARLALHGTWSDPVYGALIERKAAAVRAELTGPYERAALPGLLAALDVLVVPSIWPENAPLVLREAFAARRPVVASDSGATHESFRDGAGGLLVPAGDVDELARALDELASDRARLLQLADGVPEVRSIDEQAESLLALYEECALERSRARVRAGGALPLHARAFAGRLDALDALPNDELARRCARGLGRLRARLLQEDGPGDLTGAVSWLEGRVDRLRERLLDSERAREWLEDVARADAEERGELARRLGWREEQLAAREAELAERCAALASAERRAESLHEEAAWLRSSAGELERGVEAERRRGAWLAERLERASSEVDHLTERLEDARATLAERERQLADEAARAAELERERDWLQGLRDEARRTGAALDALQEEHRRLEEHERWLRGEVVRLVGAVLPEGQGPPDRAEIDRSIEAALARVEALRRDLAWREGEMSSAREEGERRFGSGLRRRVRSWSDEPAAPDGGREDAS